AAARRRQDDSLHERRLRSSASWTCSVPATGTCARRRADRRRQLRSIRARDQGTVAPDRARGRACRGPGGAGVRRRGCGLRRRYAARGDRRASARCARERRRLGRRRDRRPRDRRGPRRQGHPYACRTGIRNECYHRQDSQPVGPRIDPQPPEGSRMTTADGLTSCPQCGNRFPNTVRMCPHDGTVLEHATPTPAQAGQVLDGKYRLDALLAEGGMGAVYRATHVMLGKTVAIKLIRSAIVASPEIVRRFQREARAATALNHPNIVSVYDLGQTPDGTLYIAMEYIDGPSLKTLIQSGRAIPPLR